MTDPIRLILGDCIEEMAKLPAESVDAVVTDPPYGLEFMGKEWDRLGDVRQRDDATFTNGDRRHGLVRHGGSSAYGVNAGVASRRMQAWHEAWAREAFRVAKPGAHLLAFGGTRTYHRLASAIEDAGWEIRDCLCWCYASGFPKSLNLPGGLGTALKPAWEPIVMARKPLRGTVAANVQEWGTGALNIDGTRISTTDEWSAGTYGGVFGNGQPVTNPNGSPLGRWPPNLLLTDAIFDGDAPGVVGGGTTQVEPEFYERSRTDFEFTSYPIGKDYQQGYGDSGTYSRFFLIPKAARSDREPLLTPDGHDASKRFTTHPTVKPVELMCHLVRLVTPPGGVVLDCFLGSGTTAIAAQEEGFRCVGIEKEPEYMRIAEARLNGRQVGLGLDVPAATRKAPKTHPDLSKHQPKRRAPSENYSGAWAGTEEPVA